MSLDTKQKLEIVDRAISIIKETEDDKWCSFLVDDDRGHHCALGHFLYEYTDERVKKHRCYQEETLFLSYLDEIILSIIPMSILNENTIVTIVNSTTGIGCSYDFIASVNNNRHSMFKQATEKERTLAMLFYLKSLIREENQVEITYVESTEMRLMSEVNA